ncbi:hypothetical protein BJ508DRAFT_412288 [Ascobolus immersus RN42]|uniref:Tr-type G domain-containing protein n=1 Tax=Ascobolus immersus RN42 TaxID=1160509 RepID=A0A3N4IIA7_ASCIM|nr:hypothetical protein BJ508DRAFT_412288 [Ascobolus immersus RN42]
MAGIFTFDHAPTRPFSPWEGKPNGSDGTDADNSTNSTPLTRRAMRADFHPEAPRPATEQVNGLKSLVEESDLGSTEYKLTLKHASKPEDPKSADRFQHLKTQLLWRLSQTVPDRPALTGSTGESASPEQIGNLLQESKGVYYEIGVADDGTFVGISDEDMELSLGVLRRMASSLGCEVQVLKKHPVADEKRDGKLTGGKLYICEAFVKPCLFGAITGANGTSRPLDVNDAKKAIPEQLRISFTGATAAGKSTLIGTLSTSEQDNGNGRVRLSLLKHRHEVNSGVTSCVSQEIVGYRLDGVAGARKDDQVINYATANRSSWTDICSTAAAAPDGGRVVIMTDSGGVPRYRRTALRSLIGFMPHYAFVVVPADCGTGSPEAKETLELSLAHLELVLKLGIRPVVVISKLDTAGGLGNVRNAVGSIVDLLKVHNKGRELLVVQETASPNLNGWGDFEAGRADEVVEKMRRDDDLVPVFFTSSVHGKGIRLLHAFLARLPIPQACGPQVATTLNKKHQPIKTLFHIDEVYDHQGAVVTGPGTAGEQTGIVVSGYLKKGIIAIGEELWVGPFPPNALPTEHESERPRRPTSGSFTHGSYTGSPSLLSIPIAHHFLSEESGSGTDSAGPNSLPRARRPLAKSPLSEKQPNEVEWAKYRVISARSCRVPVAYLRQSEIGTFGLVPVKDTPPLSHTPPIVATPDGGNTDRFLRKGMVLLDQAPVPRTSWPKAYTGFTAVFKLPKDHGMLRGVQTSIYTACVRAGAQVVSVDVLAEPKAESPNSGGGFFDFDGDEDEEEDEGEAKAVTTEVKFRFMGRREWVETGAGVLVMMGGGKVGKGRLALGGYWGEIVGAD